MRLAKITLKDFRGFPHEETFDLVGGKNLLLYGENGSGKSSVHRALLEFFNHGANARPFRIYRNVFMSTSLLSAIDGHVTLEMTDGAQYQWRCLGERPLKDSSVSEAARNQLRDSANRSSLLDYRSLLRTNFVDSRLPERLFDLAVGVLLANVSVPVGGGEEKTIANLWNSALRSIPRRHTKSNLAILAGAEKRFNTALAGILPQLQAKTTELLSYFVDSALDVTLGVPGIQYQQLSKRFTQAELNIEVKLHGVPVPEWNQLLNEARLSALALSMYLAGTTMTNTAPAAGISPPLKLLVLDDVLIGLDLAHRLPILRIIEERFDDFQTLLLTYDRVWFDMAQLAFTKPEEWVCYEMYSRETKQADVVFDAPTVKPIGIGADHFLAVAKQHLGTPNHDIRAAALYARAALEVKLKAYCSKYKVQVPYDLDGRHLNTDHFLNAVERRLVWAGTRSLALFKLQRVNLFRNGVLNPQAHFHPVTLAKSEVAAALQAVESLSLSSDAPTDFSKQADDLLNKAAPTATELIDSACYLRTAFEVDLRALLVRHGGAVRFRADWTKIDLAELWDAAKTVMTSVNAVLAGPLVTSVEAHPAIFLNEWQYATVSALTKAQLDSAWTAIRVPAPAAPKTRLAEFA